MYLPLLDLALGLACESSQNSKSQFPKSSLQLEGRILTRSAITFWICQRKSGDQIWSGWRERAGNEVVESRIYVRIT